MTMRNLGDQTKLENHQYKTMPRSPQVRCSLVIFVVCLMGSLLFLILKKLSANNDFWSDIDFKPLEEDIAESHPWPDGVQQDRLLSGLIPEGLDEKSCLSRYQSIWYHKGLKHLPSSYLISRLRSYEALHKRCGPNTESYKRTLKYLNSGMYNSSTDCKYVVWTPLNGLGNKIITLASTFLYAILTNRVLLIDRKADVPELFCEPFPESSWLLTSDFPILDKFKKFNHNSNESYGNMLKNNALGNLNCSLLPPYIYIHIVHDYDTDDQRFFCDQDQEVLQNVPWLILKSNIYFVPSLFLMPAFEQELNNLFPDKETIFHFLGRYLFHPTNTVWRVITRYYNAHLAKADEKIGIQIRIFDTKPDPFKHYLGQILACVNKENLLPQINETERITVPSEKSKINKAVLMTSLSTRYYDAVKNMYVEHPTVTGEVVQVFQPSHEVREINSGKTQNMKAWAEIYLLSLSDKLVTSSKSTFGYVAQSLGGLKPWILYRPSEYTAPNPPCHRGVSMEPCFQAPPKLDCKSKIWIDTGKIVPHIRHCEDMSWTWGLKLYGKDGES